MIGSFQGVKRLFAFAFNNTTVDVTNNSINNTNNRVARDSHKKYFLSRVNITDCNVWIDGRNFYDQPVKDKIKKYNEIGKNATGQGDDYTTGCLRDYQYFKDHYQLIAVDLSKQKKLDADPGTIQHIEFYGKLKTNSHAGPLMKATVPIAKNVLAPLGITTCAFSNWCRNSKENTWFWNKKFNNFK